MDQRFYLLDCAMEERAELIVALSKIQRFGDDESNSEAFTDPATGFTVRIGNNVETAEKEYNDLLATLELLYEYSGIAMSRKPELVGKKRAKLGMAMRYSRQRGILI